MYKKGDVIISTVFLCIVIGLLYKGVHSLYNQQVLPVFQHSQENEHRIVMIEAEQLDA